MRKRDIYVIGCVGILLVGGLVSSLWGGVLDTAAAATAIATLLAAFLGAYFAFALNEQRETARVHRENKVALNRSLFVLARQWNAVENYYQQSAPYRSDLERAFNMPAFKQPPSYAQLAHNFDQLAFLLESSDPQLLMDLAVEQERFEQMVEAIAVRNEFYVREIQPALAESGLTGRPLHVDELQQALGERLFAGACHGVDIVCEHIEKSRISLPETHEKLFRAGKMLFPGETFIVWNREHNGPLQ